tara:strand:+ start:15824 stop:21127 length:5304 start_codon:yes stop_codon:yes gene_type:complete
MEKNVKEVGNLFVVDPNPPGGSGLEQIPPEDLFIYVKFTATPRSRQIFDGHDSKGNSKISPSGVADEVNFIATEIKYTNDGQIEIPDGQDNVDSYATTNWTGIGGLGTSSSGGMLEGFGIKSIDIKYNASLVPVVDITFTDVRGSGLFDVIKDNDRLSPYSLFFKMPYPIFKLSVKGYFGQTVEYCLHMVNWTSNFDGSTGNFDISANFLGFQQAFLNDMNIGNVIANVNTSEGLTQLNELDWTYKDADEKEFTIKNDIRKIDDFFLTISRLQIEVEDIKSNNSDELDKLKDLNGQIKLLRQIKTFIGSPIRKSTADDATKEDNYLKTKNDEIEIDSAPIKGGILEINTNYLSIRDYLVINSINENAYKSYINTLTSIMVEYNSFVTNQEIKNSNQAATKLFLDSTTDNGDQSYLVYIRPETLNTNGKSIDPKKIKDILDEMGKSSTESSLSLANNYNDNKNNENFQLSEFNKQKIRLIEQMGEVFCFVVDFRKLRESLENLIKVVDEDIKKEREEVNKLINEEIINNFKEKFGFNPTIENCFRILSNNTQALTATIYEITKKASEVKFKSRKNILKGYVTDIPESIENSVAWPAVYRTNEDAPDEEIYLGEIDNPSVDTYFPEKKYIDSIFNALVAREKVLKQVTRATATSDGTDTDNWFPINPIDYSENPFRLLNLVNDYDEMKNILANRVFLRCAILKNYSLFENKTTGVNFNNYVEMDAINANLSVFSSDSRKVLKELLDLLNKDHTILNNTEFYKKNIEKDGLEYNIKNDGPDVKIGSEKIGGKESGVNFIEFDNDKIIDNSKSLWKEVRDYPAYSTIEELKKEESGNKFIKQHYNNNNLTSEIGFNVWNNAVSKNLYKSASEKLDNYTVKDLSDIDISGDTTDEKGKYINRTNFIIPSDKGDCNYEKFMTFSDLYENQLTSYAKALLLLSTLPFKKFQEAVLDVVFDGKYKGARIINLPEYYIYLIGGYLWNHKNDGIKWDIDFSGNTNCPYSVFQTSKSQYLTKLGYLATTDDAGNEIELEPQLLELPTQTKNKFINRFKLWVDKHFNRFEEKIIDYRNEKTVPADIISAASKYLKGQFSETTNMIVFAPEIFDITNFPEKLSITGGDIKEYIKYFSGKFTSVNEKNTNGEPQTETDKIAEEKRTNDLKLAIYKYFKNINDKWVSDTKKSFGVCGGNFKGGNEKGKNPQSKDLINYFKFIDRGWADIGQKAVFNLNSFLNLSNNFKTSMYFFMSKLLRDSNFLFQILPTYINFKDATEVAKIFQPITTIENNKSSGPIYACIYVGGASKVLDIQERNNYYFKNDGFNFPNPSVENENGTLPTGFAKDGKFSQVAFRVAFGAENQTIFKNVSLNQQEHKETGEYFKALSDLVDKRGGTQKTYQGTDLYKLFDTRSYTCKIDALGCMNIQPLMYFDLQNVPFFKGAYLITSVNHNITPNHMTTNFQGVRQSKFITPPPTKITTDLNLDLDEATDIPVIEYPNLERDENDKYVIGVEKRDPNNFDFELFDVDNFKKMGVDVTYLGSDPEATIKGFATALKTAGLTTNEQVCMIMGNILTVSNNMSKLKEPIDPDPPTIHAEFNESTIYSGKYKYYGVNPPPPSSPFYDEFKNADPDSISALTPTFSAVTTNYEVYDIGTGKKQDEIQADGNLYSSDEFLYRARGYLHVKGRKEYFDIINEKWKKPYEVATTPQGAFGVAIQIWKKKKNKVEKTSFELVRDGTGGANNYAATVEIVNGENKLRESFNKFESVLLAFNLKDDFLK